ncbi:hypothetical protein TNCV_1524171 [Trichonephila clavipes]|nr:hypothetical protein TNCV_1524171 [Trichonephila clavipes]
MLKCPVGVVGKLGEGVPAQVSSTSPDHAPAELELELIHLQSDRSVKEMFKVMTLTLMNRSLLKNFHV